VPSPVVIALASPVVIALVPPVVIALAPPVVVAVVPPIVVAFGHDGEGCYHQQRYHRESHHQVPHQHDLLFLAILARIALLQLIRRNHPASDAASSFWRIFGNRKYDLVVIFDLNTRCGSTAIILLGGPNHPFEGWHHAWEVRSSIYLVLLNAK
jgi:hypothetical protein